MKGQGLSALAFQALLAGQGLLVQDDLGWLRRRLQVHTDQVPVAVNATVMVSSGISLLFTHTVQRELASCRIEHTWP